MVTVFFPTIGECMTETTSIGSSGSQSGAGMITKVYSLVLLVYSFLVVGPSRLLRRSKRRRLLRVSFLFS